MNIYEFENLRIRKFTNFRPPVTCATCPRVIESPSYEAPPNTHPLKSSKAWLGHHLTCWPIYWPVVISEKCDCGCMLYPRRAEKNIEADLITLDGRWLWNADMGIIRHMGILKFSSVSPGSTHQ